MTDDDVTSRSPVPLEQLAADLRRLFVRLGGDRTDTTVATWSRQRPEEWEANLLEFDRLLVATCQAVGLETPDMPAGEPLPARSRASLIEALADAGVDVRTG